MKILFLTNLSEQIQGLFDAKSIDTSMSCSAVGLSYPLNLLKELTEYTEVLIYSPPLQKVYETTGNSSKYSFLKDVAVKTIIPIVTNVEILCEKVKPDVVIQYVESIFPYLINFDKARCLRVLWFINGPNAAINDGSVRDFIKARKADLILKSLDKLNKLETSRDLANLNTEVHWIPFSVDGKHFRFKNLNREWDAAVIGNMFEGAYILRPRLYEYLMKRKDLKLYLPSKSYGEKYVDILNQTKILFTCTGKYRYPIVKLFEAPACRTLLASDPPIDEEELGFKAGVNYVSLEKVHRPRVALPKYPNVESDWIFDDEEMGKLVDHYLSNEAERNRITYNGEHLIHQRHTDAIRAKELFRLLSSRVTTPSPTYDLKCR